MFDQIKKLQQLKKLQEDFKKEKITIEKEGVSVEMNGNFEIENIKLSEQVELQKQQQILKDCINEAREKIQKSLAQKMMSSGIGF